MPTSTISSLGCTTGRATVIALPCSGSSGRQWHHLEAKLSGSCTVLAPDLMDYDTGLAAAGGQAFGLMDEAAPVLRMIDHAKSPVHLVGHSYGGAVALRAALERPKKIKSLALFEPTPFHLLNENCSEDAAALSEVRKIAGAVSQMISAARYEDAACIFLDYWAGNSIWSKLRPESRDAITRYAPKAPLEFSALFNEAMRLQSYARLEVPVLVLEGEYSQAPAHRIARLLRGNLPLASHAVIPGVGHMAPVTQGERVAAEIANHISRMVEMSAVEGTSSRAAA